MTICIYIHIYVYKLYILYKFIYIIHLLIIEHETQLKCKRTRWIIAEKDIVLTQFGTYLNTYKCPSLKEIATLIATNPCLQTRTVYQIKSWFNNQQKILRTF